MLIYSQLFERVYISINIILVANMNLILFISILALDLMYKIWLTGKMELIVFDCIKIASSIWGLYSSLQINCFCLVIFLFYFYSEKQMRLALAIPRKNLISCGVCVGRFSNRSSESNRSFRVHITALDLIAPLAKVRNWSLFLLISNALVLFNDSKIFSCIFSIKFGSDRVPNSSFFTDSTR